MEIQTIWVTIAATDIERSRQFYQQIFEQEPMIYNPGIYAEFEKSGLRLGIYQPRSSEFTEAEFPRMSLCLQVENLEQAISQMTQIGAEIGQIINASHGREVYVYDCDRNRIILYEPAYSAFHSH